MVDDEKYEIVQVLNRNTNSPVCKEYYNKEVDLNKSIIESGLDLTIVFSNGSSFTHEKVEQVLAFGAYGLKIVTTKKVWFIDDVATSSDEALK